jgi:alkylation response protein AidB-like acyl-CoA dehydrogenase
MPDTHAPADALDALLPELAARAGEMEEARRLPADLARKLAATGVFRMVTPRRFGGLELSPREIVETTERIAAANASAGWCAMIGATTALNAAYMEPHFAEEIYADPAIITGGVFAPMAGLSWTAPTTAFPAAGSGDPARQTAPGSAAAVRSGKMAR